MTQSPQRTTGIADLPDQIGRYRLLREIGRGSMGRVFVAYDPNIERRIALKVLLPVSRGAVAAADEEQREFQKRFVIEARAAGRISHPGIVAIYDAAIDPQSHLAFIAMELVQGQSVAQLIDARGPLGASASADLGVQAAEALAFAHAQGIVHRDVKPENILVNEQGQVKLLDFGVAKLASESHTMVGEVLGTPAYMSPEQVRSLPLDGRSDLFSLGAVLYEGLTGVSPFLGDSVATMVYKILNVQPLPIVDPVVPESLWAVVMRSLEKEPEGRFVDGRALASALRRFVPSDAEEPTALAQLVDASWVRAIESETRDSAFLADGESTSTLGTLVFTPPPREVEEMPSFRESSRGRARSSAGASGWIWALLLTSLVLAVAFRFGIVPMPREDESEGLAAESLAFDSAPWASMPDPEVETLEPATLVLLHENRLAQATLSLWIDGERVQSKGLQIRGGFVARSRGAAVQTSVPLPPGQHAIEVRITGAKGKVDASASTSAAFEEGEVRVLRIRLLPMVRKIRLSWKD